MKDVHESPHINGLYFTWYFLLFYCTDIFQRKSCNHWTQSRVMCLYIHKRSVLYLKYIWVTAMLMCATQLFVSNMIDFTHNFTLLDLIQHYNYTWMWHVCACCALPLWYVLVISLLNDADSVGDNFLCALVVFIIILIWGISLKHFSSNYLLLLAKLYVQFIHDNPFIDGDI